MQLLFHLRTEEGEVQVERMWVAVEQVEDDAYRGTLKNRPMTEEAGLERGHRIEFGAEHVMNVHFHPVGLDGWRRIPEDVVASTFVRTVHWQEEAWTLDGAQLDDAVPLWPDRAVAEAMRSGPWARHEVRRFSEDELIAWAHGVGDVALAPVDHEDAVTGRGRSLSNDLRAHRLEDASWDDQRQRTYGFPTPDPDLDRLVVFLPSDEDDDEWPPFASEILWAERVSADRFRLETIPVFAQGLARGDLVEAGFAEGTWWVMEVAEPAGGFTIRVLLEDEVDPEEFREALHREGADTQNGAGERHVAVHVPDSATLDRVTALLDDAQADGRAVDWEPAW